MEIAQEFNNSGNVYYGHGTGTKNQDIVNSIFENGLRCSHEQLNFTTIALGIGSNELFDEIKPMMDNWQHKGSKQIIIASLPQNYHLIGPMGTSLYGKEQAAFYNYFSEKEASKNGLAPGYYLKPEFVKGVYDAETQSFTENERYYENLPEEEQSQIFEEVKRKYIDLLKGSPWTLAEFASIMESSGVKLPLTMEEIAKADQEVFEAKRLEEQLQSITEKARQEDFNDTTKAMKEDERVADEEELNTDESWGLDDDWE